MHNNADGPRTKLTLDDAFPRSPVESLLDKMIDILVEIRDAMSGRQARDEEQS